MVGCGSVSFPDPAGYYNRRSGFGQRLTKSRAEMPRAASYHGDFTLKVEKVVIRFAHDRLSRSTGLGNVIPLLITDGGEHRKVSLEGVFCSVKITGG